MKSNKAAVNMQNSIVAPNIETDWNVLKRKLFYASSRWSIPRFSDAIIFPLNIIEYLGKNSVSKVIENLNDFWNDSKNLF